MRVGLRPAYRAPGTRTLHHMREAAGGLPSTWTAEGGDSKAKRGHPRGPRTKCGWAAAPSLPGAICAPTSPCAERAASGDVDQREGNPKAKRDRPVGRKCCAAGAVEPVARSLGAVIARNPRWELRHLPDEDIWGA